MNLAEYKPRKENGLATIRVEDDVKIVAFENFDSITGEKTVLEEESISDARLEALDNEIANKRLDLENQRAALESLELFKTDLANAI